MGEVLEHFSYTCLSPQESESLNSVKLSEMIDIKKVTEVSSGLNVQLTVQVAMETAALVCSVPSFLSI